MRRLGPALCTAAWIYLALHGAAGRLPVPERAAVIGLSLAGAFGRAAECVYVAGAIWPAFYPSRGIAIVAGVLGVATGLQFGVWAVRLGSRVRSGLAGRAARRDSWRFDWDEDPAYSPAGTPVNRAAWRQLSPEAFEEEVLALFKRHGFAGELTSLSGDGGIDLEMERDGRHVVAQCKHYLKPVGQPAVRDFAGAMRAAGADLGYFITTSRFTDAAVRWAADLEPPPIVLIDGPALVRWALEGREPEWKTSKRAR